MKRYIYIVAGAVGIVIIAIGVFWFISQQRSTPGVTGTTGSLPAVGNQNTGTGGNGNGGAGSGNSSGGTGVAGSSGAPGTVKSFGVLSNDPAFDYFVDAQNNVILVQPNGTIEAVANGQVTSLSSTTIANVISASFSYDGKKVLVSSGDPANPQTSIFNIASSSWTPLPQGMQSPAWAPSDSRIAYLSTVSATGVSSVVVFDASAKKIATTTLLSLNAPDLTLRWFNKSQLILSDRPSVFVGGSALLFDMVSKSLTPLVSEAPGMEGIWENAVATGTTGMGLVFTSDATARGGHLTLNDLSGNVIQNLKFSTLPTKCAFASEMIAASTTPILFCAVPRDQDAFSFAHIPDDYNQMSLYTSDDVYLINLVSGAIGTTWSDQSQNLDVSDVKFFNNTLFFINRYDQKLYGMVINQD